MVVDIAIVGASFKMPQEAVNENGLWDILEQGKNVMTEWPKTRVNLDSFYDTDLNHFNKLHSKGAHFFKQDPALFDAPFFSITAKEAAAIDPQHRMTLEASYRAFENAGITVEALKGSRTAVFAASSSDDYYKMILKDSESIARGTINGSAVTMLANRSLRAGEASMALVAGANLLLGPEGSVMLANGNYLSPDSVCYSFDQRANGYARGEGIVALVIKPVLDAVRDGDMIRAVIRSTGSNQNGRTAIITQPSAKAQEHLIRDVYHEAGLDLKSTRYFEAHGTGTAVGDPAELEAVGKVFGPCRSSKQPLYVGSIKSNIGHLEGSSGLAGVIKAMLILEKGVIPPTALFQKINSAIDAEQYHLEIPTECIKWPTTGLRRVSVNSFGFGGSNGHIIMDDALHYLQSHGLSGNHCTTQLRPNLAHYVNEHNEHHDDVNKMNGSHLCVNQRANSENSISTGSEANGCSSVERKNINALESRSSKDLDGPQVLEEAQYTSAMNGGTITAQDSSLFASIQESPLHPPLKTTTFDPQSRLLVWTAADEETLKNMVRDYEEYYRSQVKHDQSKLERLAFTLATRRSVMLWRSFAIASTNSVENTKPFIINPTRAQAEARVAFIFTGQGAQYTEMGLELIQYPAFAKTLQRVDSVLHSLGCNWSVIDELKNGDNINLPQYSQPLCTALQLALVELLKSFDVRPSAVLGHSSGEIAAAYAAGALSFASACKVAYFRGLVAEDLRRSTEVPGAMLSANVPSSEIPAYLNSVVPSGLAKRISIACINSPCNSTLSGPEPDVDKVKEQLEKDGIFSKKLNTGVSYHSHSMQAVGSQYSDLMGTLESGDCQSNPAVPMISSVSGKIIPSQSLSETEYWVNNLISPVEFSRALTTLTSEHLRLGVITDLVEIGPHPALRRPIQDTLPQTGFSKKSIRYSHMLYKSKSALQSTLQLLGQLFCNGVAISVTSVNQHLSRSTSRPFCVDCPEYPFNHSMAYWREPRLSRDYRLRESAPVDALGARFHDWNPLEPRWRKFLSAESTPWTKDHIVLDSFLYPGTGMIIMALEAVKQMCPTTREISGFQIEEAHFSNPIVVGETDEESTEVIVQLRRIQTAYEKESVWSSVTIMTQSDGQWTQCFQARIQVQYMEHAITEVDGGLEAALWEQQISSHVEDAAKSCTMTLDRLAFYDHCRKAGICYGPTFRLLDNISWDGDAIATARISMTTTEHQTTSLTHPAVLDCALQLLLAQATRGLSDELLTFVPNHIFNMWIAAKGWQPPQTRSVRVLAESLQDSSPEAIKATIHVTGEDDLPLCVMKRIIMSPVSGMRQADDGDTKLLHTIQWKPQFSLMSPSELQHALGDDTSDKDTTEIANFRKVLEPTLNRVLRETLQGLSATDRLRVPSSLRKYIRWMEHHTNSHGSTIEDFATQSLETQLEELESLYPPWRIFPAIARNLRSILLGVTDPLAIAFEEGLAEAFYADVFSTTCDRNFCKCFDLLSHENPTLRILEVGAGTGGITRHILSALSQLEQSTGGVRFAEYTYTDVSASFLEGAQIGFQDFANRMTFKTFDLDRSPVEQGFKESSYDIVIAGCVLHATKDLKLTLRNLRSVIKPGGHLVYLEVVVPEKVITNFAFGVLPGWWSSVEHFRDLSPTITEKQWDLILQDSGFSGNDLVLRDYESDADHIFSTMVSTRCESRNGRSGECQRLLIVHQPSDAKATCLADSIRDLDAHYEVVALSLEQVEQTEFGMDDIVVCLLEVSKSLLASIPDYEYRILKDIISRVKNLVWVTSASADNEQEPYYDVSQGFWRSIRSENIEKRIITLAIESELHHEMVLTHARVVSKVLAATFESGSKEVEYRVHDGQLLTGRLAEDMELNAKLRSLVHPQLRLEQWKQGPPVKLITRTTGFLDTLEFTEDNSSGDLGAYEVEIEPKAWALNFRDVFVAMGRLSSEGLGYDCAGIVKRVGSSCDSAIIQPGDRVCGGSVGCMRTYPRLHISHLAKIPDSFSFESAASVITPAGATGQMAIEVAKMVGAEIFATVGLNEKKELLMNKFGIPSENIFYSRDTSFSRGIMRLTKGYGVDVILNSLAGNSLRQSWQCIASFGRFIEIGKTDIEANSGLPMENFGRNTSFCAVDLYSVGQDKPELYGRLFKDTMSLVFGGTIQPPQPLNTFSAENLEQAFRYLQSGKSSGRVVVRVNDTDVVPKRLHERSTWKFDPNASYVVVGGLGGLGRAISKWMVDKGATNLILLSRSGAASSAAARLVASLREQGTTIVAPKCDVSSEASLAAVLKECATMPPIKGCINAAMSLRDSIFANMTHGQWQETLESKVQTSWNLHKLLPAALDFFILLSSLSGIYGSISQPNYSAGCTFQDALARYRVAHRQKAISLDLGWMRNIGIVAETEAYLENRLVLHNMMPIEDTELLALLDLVCDPATPIQQSQLLVGPVTPAQSLLRGLEPSALALRPLFSPFSMVVGQEKKAEGGAVNFESLFRQASGPDERAEVVIQGLATRLARAMSIATKDIEPSRHLSDYGVDSLMAIELRNWISRDFGSNLAVFDMMGAATIEDIGHLVVSRSEFVKAK
ncbi:hypothetical protein F5Y01DRAFT_327941 [Xylaria sp. FL0043]|nr:hypothetical protein F5Y01DRAFT_327941 [Xylaria sp. FL0043]